MRHVAAGIHLDSRRMTRRHDLGERNWFLPVAEDDWTSTETQAMIYFRIALVLPPQLIGTHKYPQY